MKVMANVQVDLEVLKAKVKKTKKYKQSVKSLV